MGSGSLSSFSLREGMFRSLQCFGLPFSHISLELTSPIGREYIPGVVKRGDSSAGAGIRGVPGKANSYPSGAMASTSEDLLIWLDALFHNRVLKPETLQLSRIYLDARRNGRDDSIVGYGLGLAQYELNGHKMEGHPGGGFGGECFPFYVPDKDVSIVVQYNWSKKDNPAGKVLVTRIIEQLLNDPNLRIK
jgi:hypothetical protein